MKRFILFLSIFSLSLGYLSAQSIDSFVDHKICGTELQQLAISEIVFTGTDPVEIVDVTYSNDALNMVDYFFEDGVWNIYVVPNYSNGFSGQFSVFLQFNTIGDATILYDTIQVTMVEKPTIATSEGHVCDNAGELDLNAFVSPKGGGFYYGPEGDIYSSNGIIDLDALIDDLGGSTSAFSYAYAYVDENGCIYDDQYDVINLMGSPAITIDSFQNTTCNSNDGEIYTSLSVPSPSYESFWNNGEQNINFIQGLGAGNYTYTVIDSHGCTAKLSKTIETTDLEIAGSIFNVKCKGGSDGKININITEGSGNYKVIWSSGHSSTSLSGLTAGTYTVKVTDLANNCVAYKNFKVEEPEYEFEASFSSSAASSCTSNDGYIKYFYGFNGTAPFEFMWNTGSTSDSLTDIVSGIYSVVVTDSNGCVAKKEFSLNSPDAPYAYGNIIKPSCGMMNNGEVQIISVNPSGSEEITGYSWSNGSTKRHIDNLGVGTYTLTLTQSDGCQGVFNFVLDHKKFTYSPKICIVTVDTSTNTNLVVWEKEAGNPYDIDYFKIYRANAVTGQYQVVGQVDYAQISVFNDVVASPEERSWMYKISAVNTCGQESHLSPHHKTIHLVMRDGIDQDEKRLTWDHYEGLIYPYYNLYRGTDVDGWQLIQGNISINTLPDFTDILPQGATEVDYIVEVIPTSGGCTATFFKAQDYNSSRSNKPRPIFDVGVGTGDPHNSLVTLENNEFNVLVYPNPSNGEFKVEVKENTNDQNLFMTVMGVNGSVIHQQSLDNDLNTLQLNVGAGIYFIRIQGGNTMETIKMIIR